MRKMIILSILLIAAFFLLAGCGDANTIEAGTAAATKDAEVSAAQGDVVAYDGFSVAVADGWERMDVPGGVQIYKTSGDILQIQISGENMTEEDDLAQMEILKESYSGSDIQTIQLLGKEFIKMSYTASGVEQCIYTTVSDGKQIKIQATGASYDALPDIKIMVESIQFKIG